MFIWCLFVCKHAEKNGITWSSSTHIDSYTTLFILKKCQIMRNNEREEGENRVEDHHN
jgi:hypothetical protein